MKRQTIVLLVLAAVLVTALWWMLLYSPQRDEQAALEMQRDQVLAEQATLRQEIVQLETVRETAPELQARLLAGETLIPHDVALPSALRQLQLAAEDSGVVLRTISAGRPVTVGEPSVITPGAQLSSIQLTLAVEGEYFQLVDLLRRLEDPSITGRGLLTQTMSLAPQEYPELVASVTVQAYAVIPPSLDPSAEAAEPEPIIDADGNPIEGSDAEGDAEGADEADVQTEDAA